jgi:hypothetical protein
MAGPGTAGFRAIGCIIATITVSLLFISYLGALSAQTQRFALVVDAGSSGTRM